MIGGEEGKEEEDSDDGRAKDDRRKIRKWQMIRGLRIGVIGE